MNRIRTAVIGVGYLGRFHAEKYASLPEAELVGIADPDRERTGPLAKTLNTRAFDDGMELLGKVDAVSIVAPTVLHHRLALPFLRAGIHVLLEKPIAVTLDQADELIREAEKAGVVLQIGHIERFNPAITALKPLVASPRYIQAERCAPFTPRCTDVNVVLDLMIHDLDIVADLADSAPKLVSAAGASVITREIDSASARIVFANGTIADVEASRISDEKKRILRVFDSERLCTADYQTQTAQVSSRGTGPVQGFESQTVPTERKDTLLEEIRDFLRCIRTAGQPRVSGREGRNALALAQLITRSIETGNTDFIPVA
ncbi:MAG: Gfo/Idh/MocA family oxidoreductase [Nitrospiraceae bacterium]|nr:Gfo/Idh/MocA family oxidoreductase [Nitrospiraceae bacterium]